MKRVPECVTAKSGGEGRMEHHHLSSVRKEGVNGGGDRWQIGAPTVRDGSGDYGVTAESQGPPQSGMPSGIAATGSDG